MILRYINSIVTFTFTFTFTSIRYRSIACIACLFTVAQFFLSCTFHVYPLSFKYYFNWEIFIFFKLCGHNLNGEGVNWYRVRGLVGSTHCGRSGRQTDNIQIVTGIEVNSESYFPKLRQYCPSSEGTRAIFPQLMEIRLTIDRLWQSLFVLLYLWSKWRRN